MFFFHVFFPINENILLESFSVSLASESLFCEFETTHTYRYSVIQNVYSEQIPESIITVTVLCLGVMYSK